MARRKSSSVTNVYDPEVVISAHYYLKKILGEFDIQICPDKKMLSMFEPSILKRLIENILRPAQDKINLEEGENENSTKYQKNYRKYHNSRSEFDCLNKQNFSLDDLENDLRVYIDKVDDSITKIQDFFIGELDRSLKFFDITKMNMYIKIEKTFNSLGLNKNFIPLIHLLGILSEFTVLEEWLLNSYADDLFLMKISRICNLPKAEIIKQSSKKSKLALFGILEENNRSRHGKQIDITDNFAQYLAEDGSDIYGMRLVKQDYEVPQELQSFYLPEKEKERIQSLLSNNNSAKILLYGAPGSGKTEFAKSLAYSLKSPLLKIDVHDADDTDERRAALVVGELSTRENQGILLMDESDDLLNEGNQFKFFFFQSAPIAEKKIWMNEFLDNIRGRVIFITNESASIHESVRRRFDYSLEFYPADQKQREYYWKRVLDLEGSKSLIPSEKIQEFSETYPVGVGGITSSIRSTKKICNLGNNHNFIPVLQDVLSKHVHLLGGKIQKPMLSKTPYDRSLLNTDADLSSLEMLVRSYRDELDSSENFNLGSLCLLFYGKSGTGKTEYARFLSRELGIELIQKRSSDLKSMWLGETEKKIASAFREAEKKKSILFLDEADTFFRSRELATHSYEGSQTNEFLTWMENFRGIFIASTNFITDFDLAVLRRFAWKGEFKPLRREDKVKILLQYFPFVPHKFKELDFENIKDIPELTPGDFRALWNRMRFRNTEEISSEEIISALRTEVSFKSQNQKQIAGF